MKPPSQRRREAEQERVNIMLGSFSDPEYYTAERSLTPPSTLNGGTYRFTRKVERKQGSE